jgi:hypothetical protein
LVPRPRNSNDAGIHWPRTQNDVATFRSRTERIRGTQQNGSTPEGEEDLTHHLWAVSQKNPPNLCTEKKLFAEAVSHKPMSLSIAETMVGPSVLDQERVHGTLAKLVRILFHTPKQWFSKVKGLSFGNTLAGSLFGSRDDAELPESRAQKKALSHVAPSAVLLFAVGSFDGVIVFVVASVMLQILE